MSSADLGTNIVLVLYYDIKLDNNLYSKNGNEP